MMERFRPNHFLSKKGTKALRALVPFHDENIRHFPRKAQEVSFIENPRQLRCLGSTIRNPLYRSPCKAGGSILAFFIETISTPFHNFPQLYPQAGGGKAKGGTPINPSNKADKKRKGRCGGGAGASSLTLSYNQG